MKKELSEIIGQQIAELKNEINQLDKTDLDYITGLSIRQIQIATLQKALTEYYEQ